MRRIRVLLLPSIPYAPSRQNFAPGSGPDRSAFFQALAAHGVDVDLLDPTGFPLNPLAGKHPLLQSFDLYRTLTVLLGRRDYDLVLSGNEGAAVLLVLLRRWFRFRTPILIWDLSPATRWRWRARLQDYILPKVDGILALTSIQKSYVAQRWGSHIPVHMVGWFVDTEFYQPAAESNGDCVLSVGEDAGRDFATLLDAVADLAVPIRIRTSVPWVLDPVKHRHVEIIRDRLPAIDFRSLYANSRFIVLPLLPDRRNASGVNALLKSAAMGKAAIVSDSDGIRDFMNSRRDLPGRSRTRCGCASRCNRAAVQRAGNLRAAGPQRAPVRRWAVFSGACGMQIRRGSAHLRRQKIKDAGRLEHEVVE